MFCGKPHVEGICLLDLLHIFLLEPQPQRFNIALQMFQLSCPTDREHLWRLMHHVGQRNTCNQCILSLSHLLQHFIYLLRILWLGNSSNPGSILPNLIFRFEPTPTQCALRYQRHSSVLAHGDDFSSKGALGGGPFALIDGELTQTVLAGVGVTLDDELGMRIRYTEVENFASGEEVVEGLHYFGDARVHVPPVHVELEKEENDQLCWT